MKYIIVVDGVESTRYKYNLWRVHEYEDGAVSEESRAVFSDQLEDFLTQVGLVLAEENE